MKLSFVPRSQGHPWAQVVVLVIIITYVLLLQKIVEEYYPEIRINSQPTAVSFENTRLLVSGEFYIGWACAGTYR